jgi:pimeloyl-ACP methyl ester carboxylesterase
MQEPRLDSVTCASPAGLHRMAYWEWGDPANDKVLVCVHGLTRTGRDFDELARELAGDFRVVCPDVAGRGASDWLANPALYTVPQYVSDMVTLIARLRPGVLRWVGTSMGGLIGMALNGAAAMARALRQAGMPAAKPWNDLPEAAGIRFDRVVINDVGPRLDPPALARIGQYVGAASEFDTFEQAVQAVRESSLTFGPHTPQQWETLARYVYRQRGGRWVKHYDLSLAGPLVAAQTPDVYAASEQILWQSYEAFDCPVLIVHGAESDLLSDATVAEMRRRNPRAQVLEVPGVGHAPTLMTRAQIEPVAAFLRG